MIVEYSTKCLLRFAIVKSQHLTNKHLMRAGVVRLEFNSLSFNPNRPTDRLYYVLSRVVTISTVTEKKIQQLFVGLHVLTCTSTGVGV